MKPPKLTSLTTTLNTTPTRLHNILILLTQPSFSPTSSILNLTLMGDSYSHTMLTPNFILEYTGVLYTNGEETFITFTQTSHYYNPYPILTIHIPKTHITHDILISYIYSTICMEFEYY